MKQNNYSKGNSQLVEINYVPVAYYRNLKFETNLSHSEAATKLRCVRVDIHVNMLDKKNSYRHHVMRKTSLQNSYSNVYIFLTILIGYFNLLKFDDN